MHDESLEASDSEDDEVQPTASGPADREKKAPKKVVIAPRRMSSGGVSCRRGLMSLQGRSIIVWSSHDQKTSFCQHCVQSLSLCCFFLAE